MNLYAHFPFCRRKCAYCSLYSRTGVPQSARDAYAVRLSTQFDESTNRRIEKLPLSTVYFGGGSPALCDLRPLFAALRPHLSPATEFTVELHPLDVSEPLLATLREGGVNRISMGVQSFDDATLAAMGRGYTLAEALVAFERVTRHFDNAGIDLIVGFPGDPGCSESALARFAELGLKHCSVYSLQNERQLENVPDDDTVLDRIRRVADLLARLGLHRYEISNYAVPGCECRHNLAVWRGEDYVGLGEGACGRLGLTRTRGVRKGAANPVAPSASDPLPAGHLGEIFYKTERLTPEEDRKERTIFRLRTREGLDTALFPEWRPTLDRFVAEGLLTADRRTPGVVYRLTPRGTEVCDAILAEIV